MNAMPSTQRGRELESAALIRECSLKLEAARRMIKPDEMGQRIRDMLYDAEATIMQARTKIDKRTEEQYVQAM